MKIESTHTHKEKEIETRRFTYAVSIKETNDVINVNRHIIIFFWRTICVKTISIFIHLQNSRETIIIYMWHSSSILRIYRVYICFEIKNNDACVCVYQRESKQQQRQKDQFEIAKQQRSSNVHYAQKEKHIKIKRNRR